MSRSLPKAALLAASLMLSIPAQQAKANEPLAGFDKLEITAPHRTQKLAASIWYPAGSKTYQAPVGENPIFKGVKAYVGAAKPKGQYPLVLFSHGSGGSMDSMAWLASSLAKQGAIVLALNHRGSTSGDSSPRRAIQHWTRPKDLSAALTQILEDPTFAPLIDQSNIAALGFSFGGSTVLQLAGAQPELKRYMSYCDTWKEKAEDCLFFQKGGVDFDKLSAKHFDQNTRDPRITKTIAIDPGLTYSYSPDSVKNVKTPTLILSLGNPSEQHIAVDVSEKGSNLANELANATHQTIAPANHFSALPLCKPKAAFILKEEGDDPICDDPQGADRAKVHADIASKAARFLGL